MNVENNHRWKLGIKMSALALTVTSLTLERLSRSSGTFGTNIDPVVGQVLNETRTGIGIGLIWATSYMLLHKAMPESERLAKFISCLIPAALLGTLLLHETMGLGGNGMNPIELGPMLVAVLGTLSFFDLAASFHAK